MDNRNTRCAYHLTEKSDWGAKSITVSNLPVYCRIHICYSLYPKKGQIGVAWAWNQEGTEKLVNGKQHFIWYVPSGMNGPPQNVHLNFWLEFLKSDLTIYLPSRILEIFCQMVSTLVVCPINRVLLKIVCIFPLSGLLSEFCSFGYGLKDHFSLTQVKCHIWLTSNKSDDVTSGTRTRFQKVSYRQWRNECLNLWWSLQSRITMLTELNEEFCFSFL